MTTDQNIPITIYTTDDCIYCKRLKSRMDKAGIEYTEVSDIDEIKRKGFVTVPQLDVDGVVYDYYQAVDAISAIADRNKGLALNRETPVHFLSAEFLSRYPDHPTHMTNLGLFVYYRTYSRFLPDEGRRETWKETVTRAVEYNISLDYKHRKKIGIPVPMDWLSQEAEDLFDAVFNLKMFLAGRTLWSANSPASEKYPMSNFNCSFTNIEKWEDFGEVFYLLMLGSGVGFKSTPSMALKMAPIRVNTTLLLSEYRPLPPEQRLENTEARFLDNGFAKIYVGDSKEGWRDALLSYFNILTNREYENIHTIKVSFNSVRPKGERLKSFGGTASGPEPLKEMFQGIDNALKNKIDPSLDPIEADDKGYGHVRPIHVLDICNLIASNVVMGGVRRSAMIGLFDSKDIELLFAKYGINGFWKEADFEAHEAVRQQLIKMKVPIPSWFDELAKKEYFEGSDIPHNFGRQNIGHRRLSNNSVALTGKLDPDMLHLIFLMLRLDGEPGFINMEAAGRRRDNMQGANPCGEILLDSKQQCNLTTVNMTTLVKNGEFDAYEAQMIQSLSARAGMRMTMIDLEMPEWDEKQKRDRLIGCSISGLMDALSDVMWDDMGKFAHILNMMRSYVDEAAAEYAHKLRIALPLLKTTFKPDGTLALVAGGVSPGVHDAHSRYFIRRIRVSSDDALAKMALDIGWPVFPEVGTPDNKIENARTLVIEFPVKSGARRTKDDVGALAQYNRYLTVQQNYTQHNTSNTITVKPDEWDDLEYAIADTWDEFVGVSFLPHDGGTYQLAPYEAITKEEYERRVAESIPFDPGVLSKYETVGESDVDADDPDCATGACPVR